MVRISRRVLSTDANGFNVTPGDFIDRDGNWVDPRASGVRVPGTFRDPTGVSDLTAITFDDKPYKYVATGLTEDENGNFIAPQLLSEPFDQIDRFFNPGQYLSNTISISRNMENTNFHMSFGNLEEAGVVDGIDGLARRNVRINVDHNFRNSFKISATGLLSQTGRDLVDQTGGGFFALQFMSPDADLVAVNPQTGKFFVQPDPQSVEDNPFIFIRENDREDSRKRVMGSFALDWEPIRGVNLEGSLSYDRSDRHNELFWPIGFTGIDPGPEIDGRLIIGDVKDEALNGSMTASYAARLGDMTLRAKGRALFERTEFTFHQTDGFDLKVRDTRSLSTANPDISNLSSSIRQIRSNGYSGIVGFDYKDRYIADFLVRYDGSSLFGQDERWHPYFRVSGAYRLSQEAWWFAPDLFQEFKFRASYGTAGGRPNFFARFETWAVSGGNVSKANLGNRLLKPEFAKELELGWDATLLNRFTLELTHARSNVEDQILFVPLPSYAGYSNQWQNAGTLETNTWEATINTSIMQSRNMTWTAGVTFDRTRQTIAKLDVPQYSVDPFLVREGEDLGAIWGDMWVDDLGMLPAGLPSSQFNVNDDGYVVWVGEGNSFRDGISKELWGTSIDLMDSDGTTHTYRWGIPIKFINPDDGSLFNRLGSSVPDFNLGFNTTMRIKGLTIYGLLDAQIGGDVYNNTVQWGLRELRHGFADQGGKTDDLKKPQLYYATLYNVNATNSHFVEDGTYLKLRELSVRYSFNQNQLSSIFGGFLNKVTFGVVGRNLLTFTNYSGFDPEVGSTGFSFGSAAVARSDDFLYPNFRTFTGTIEFEF